MQSKLIPGVLSLLAMVAIYLYSLYAMTLPYKLLYILIGALAVQAALMEMESMGCTMRDCSDASTYKATRTDDVACTESRRANWRRVLVMSFIVLLFMNVFNSNNIPMNFLAFFLTFSFWYAYLGFDAYHHFRVLCEHGRTCYRSSANEFQPSTPAGNP